MDYNFKEGKRFFIKNEEFEIICIDKSDDAYPYETYPVKIIEKTKHILENGWVKEVDSFGDEVYEFIDKDGESYQYTDVDKKHGWKYVIFDFFTAECQCMSENDIWQYLHIQMEKELKKAKGEDYKGIADSSNEKQEFNGLPKSKNVAIAILDIFEDMLSEKGIMIPDEDREGNEDECCLYGTTYYNLEDQIVEVLEKHYPKA